MVLPKGKLNRPESSTLLPFVVLQIKSVVLGSHHSSVVSSALTILRSRV